MWGMSRAGRDRAFYHFCRFVTWSAIVILVVLVSHVALKGLSWISWDFLTGLGSRDPQKAGIKTAVMGSLWLIFLTAAFAIPFGVATAVFLHEYADNKSKMIRILQVNIANLAGMPSIIYGLLGLTLFVRGLGFEDSLLSGALTLALLILPVIVISSQEAIRAVPNSVRYGAYALGARKWQVILWQVLPAALPGIMTGVILSISRAIGETAPLVIIGALSYISFVPDSVYSSFTALPVQIYNWAQRPQAEFHSLAAAGIIVLLAVLFTMNLTAILIRQKYQRYKL